MAVTQATLVPFFTLLSLFFFFSFLQGQKRHLLFFACSLALGFYSYDVAKLFLPLFFGGILWIYSHDLKKKWKDNARLYIISSVLFVMMVLPIIVLHIQGEGL